MTARTYTPRKPAEARVKLGLAVKESTRDKLYRWAEGQGISYVYALEVLVEAGLEFYRGEAEADGA